MIGELLNILGVKDYEMQKMDSDAYETYQSLLATEKNLVEGKIDAVENQMFDNKVRTFVNYLRGEEFQAKLRDVGAIDDTNLGEIDLPDLDLPDLDLPEIDEPKVDEPEIQIDVPEVPEEDLPDLDLPDLDLPDLDLPDLDLPDLDLPEIDEPEEDETQEDEPQIKADIFYVAKTRATGEIKEKDSIAIDMLLGAGNFSARYSDYSKGKGEFLHHYFIDLPKLHGFIKIESQIGLIKENGEIDELIYEAFKNRTNIFIGSTDEECFVYMLNIAGSGKDLADNEILDDSQAQEAVLKNNERRLFNESSLERNSPMSYTNVGSQILEENKLFGQYVYQDGNTLKDLQEFMYAQSTSSVANGINNPHNYIISRLYFPSEEVYARGGTYRNFGSKTILYSPSNSKFTFYESNPKDIDVSKRNFEKKGEKVSFNVKEAEKPSKLMLLTLKDESVLFLNSDVKIVRLDLLIFNYFHAHYKNLYYEFMDSGDFRGILFRSGGDIVGAKQIAKSEIITYTNESVFPSGSAPFNYSWEFDILTAPYVNMIEDEQLRKIVPSLEVGIEIESEVEEEISEERQKGLDYIETLTETLAYVEEGTEERKKLEEYIETLKTYI